MIGKQVVVVVVLVAVLGVVAVSGSLAADRYPAGLNPALCPNYPHCDNVLLALHGNGLHGVPAVPTVTVWNGREYPAGISPAACPNYPFCNTGIAGGVVPLPGYAQREYPAGVSPAACPNYPYCH